MHVRDLWARHPAIAGGSVYRVQAVSSRVTPSPPSRCRAARSRFGTTRLTTVPGTQKALSLAGKGLDLRTLVAGEDLNLRPLGYEHYDARLPCLRRPASSPLTRPR
jgi:hypothetical protein